MSKILKLSGVKTFIASPTRGVTLVKGQTAKFTDTVGMRLLKSQRKDKENNPLPYFTEMEGGKVDFDFSEEVEDGDVVVPPAKVPARASRSQRPAAQDAASVA